MKAPLFSLPGINPVSEDWEPAPCAGNFMTLAGPIWRKRVHDQFIYGLLGQEKHANHRTIVYGGIIMAFAAYVLGNLTVAEELPQVALQLDVHFLAAANIGDFMIGRGEIMRRSSSIVFSRGTIQTADRTIASMHGVRRISNPRFASQCQPDNSSA